MKPGMVQEATVAGLVCKACSRTVLSPWRQGGFHRPLDLNLKPKTDGSEMEDGPHLSVLGSSGARNQ